MGVVTTWPERLLTQNSELRKDNIWNWSLPAHVVKLTDGTNFNVCPQAGSCGRVCYAKFGTYNFSNVRGRHIKNLEYTLQEPDAWQQQMIDELGNKRFRPKGQPRTVDGLPTWCTGHDWTDRWLDNGGAAVRIHDGGDFYSWQYLELWLEIARQVPDVLFYSYTKEVALFRNYAHKMPANFQYVFSYGGKLDHLIDPNNDRHADVFPTLTTLLDAGYTDQSNNDLLAVLLPTNKIGIVANNLPVANKRFAGRPMSGMTAT